MRSAYLVEWLEGNNADYEEDKKRRRVDDAATQTHRITYKKFTG